MKSHQCLQRQKLFNKVITRRIACGGLSVLMGISIAGGWFLPLADQNRTDKIGSRWTIDNLIQKARADSLTAVSVDSMAQTTTTNFTDESAYVTKLDATSGNFTGGHKYFVYWHMSLASSNLAGMVRWQVKYGDTEIYVGAIEPSAGTANDAQQVSFIDVYTQPATPVAITVGFKNYTGHNFTASAFNASLVAMDLSDKCIENYDYYYDEDTTSYEHTTSPVSMASITLANADATKDWLVFAMEDIAIDNAGQNAVADIWDGSTAYMARTQEGEDADYLEQFTFVLYRAFDNTARNTTYSIRVSDDGTPADPATRNNHVKSRIFALSMEVFDKYSSTYASGSTALATSGTWTEVDTLSHTPNTTGNQVVFGGYTNAVAAANVQTNDRLTVDGTTPLPSGWSQALAGGGKTSYDATDYTTSNLLTVVSMNTDAHTIDVDATEISGTSQVAIDSAIVAFSTLYKYIPRVNKWRWYGDEADTTPDTAYAAENTAPAQEEIGKSISFKLRVNFTEVGNAAENNNRKKIYYSTSATGPWTTVGATTDTDYVWRYYNGGGADNDLVNSSTVLTGSTARGIHNESNSDSPSNSDHAAGATAEFEYCIENYNATANTTYYFAFFDQTIGLIPPSSGTSTNLPSITTASAYDLGLSAPGSVALGNFQFGSGAYHAYDFIVGEEINVRDNRGQTTGNSSGWSLTAAMSTELYAESVAGYCGDVAFTGSGLNDLSIISCENTLSSSAVFRVTVLFTVTSPDLCGWTKDGSPVGSGDCGTMDLGDGVITQTAAADGHTTNDYWEFTAYPSVGTTITDDNTYWMSDNVVGKYAAPTTNITTQSGSYMGSAVTALTVSSNSKDGLGGFYTMPTMRLYGLTAVGSYLGVLTFTLT